MTTHKNTHAHATTTSSSDPAAQAEEALATLKQLSASLPIDDAIPPNQLTSTRVISRVPLEAMTIAAGVLKDNPEQFPQFDATDAQGAIAYEQAMAPVGTAAQMLATRITKSVLKRRSTMAQNTLALYQVMKGTSRLPANEQTRTQVKALSKLFTTHKKARDTAVTQKETKVMVRTRKTSKKQEVAKATADQANTNLAIASAQAALENAVATGTVPPVMQPVAAPAPAPASPTPATPVAIPPVVTPSH